MTNSAIKLENVVKTFGGVHALKNVCLEVKKGEIHALLGENGAGKSTLMNILGGVLKMDSGIAIIFGQEVNLKSPHHSQELGIAFIHQELNVINDLKVYENMFLGYELRNKYGALDSQTMCKKTAEVFEQMNVHIDPKAMVRDLETSYKQLIEIAKALLRNAKIIIMDEPTTSLTACEIEDVFHMMRNLTEKGISIIFISHKLQEVVDFCDSYSVLRNGENVSSGKIEEDGEKITTTSLAMQMVGRDVYCEKVFQERKFGKVVLGVENISVGNYVKDISFNLREGEILGFTGLLGDGKDELLRSLFGDIKITSGKVMLDGKEIKLSSPEKARKLKIGFLPSNRKENAIIKDMNIIENMTISTIAKFIKFFHIKRKKQIQVSNDYVRKLKIKVNDLNNKITSLSGGNQQKVVLAKWMNANPKIMILSNPTQGVDVGAKNQIYHEIFELAKTGVAVIVASAEVEEVLKLSDRVMVMYHGHLRGELSREEVNEEAVMVLATGCQLC